MPTRKIPWLRIFAEGVVIVASVLLALAADAWWDQRQQLEEEIAVLEGLQADLEATLSVIHAQRTAKEHKIAVASRLISLGGPDPVQVPAATVDTLLADLITGEAFQPVDATIQALLSGDGLQLISSPRLRAMIAGWSPLVATIRVNEEQSQGQMLDYFLPYLHSRVSMRSLDATIGGMPDPPSNFSVDVRPLLSDLRFENYVNDLLFFYRMRLQHFDRLEEHVEDVLALIEAELSQGSA